MTNRSNISCPFCNEPDFDLVGLKLHLTVWGCNIYEDLDIIRELEVESSKRGADVEEKTEPK